MVGKPIVVATPHTQLILKLPDSYYPLSDTEIEEATESFALLAAAMLNVLEGVLQDPDLGPLAARSVKAMAQMLEEEQKEESDASDPRNSN